MNIEALVNEGLKIRDEQGLALKIANILHSKHDITDDVRTEHQTSTLLRNRYKKSKDILITPALSQACDDRGIDINSVGIAWNKDKAWSIQFALALIQVRHLNRC